MEMSKNEKIKRSLLIIVIMVIACTSIIISRNKREEKKQQPPEQEQKMEVKLSGKYDIDIIKEFNAASNGSNYLLSPYNIEIALNLLREGADGNTKDELDKVLGNRVINDVSIPNVIGVANGLFIKNKYKNNVKKEFQNILDSKYHSEVIYDDFKTPAKINNWVNEKTNGMIKEILDHVDEQFVLGLASALSIDVKWLNSFECIDTISQEFTKIDNQKINVEMMNKTYEYNAKYFKNQDATGVILPYASKNKNIELEFVGILPDGNVYDYVNNLNEEKLNNIYSNLKEASETFRIQLSLPRFTYGYELSNGFVKALNNMGINDAFNPNTANFKKMVDINTYVSDAIHKTYIELSETGTKAAAVTYFGIEASGIREEPQYEKVVVEFNRPFAYMIREKNTEEILFFGVVNEPNLWNGSTCNEQ